jgi:hypothetical protein
LLEELAVEVLDVSPASYSREDDTSGFIIEFVPTAIRGEPRAVEHDELAWVHHPDLLNYDLAPSDRLFVAWLLANRTVGGAE